MPLDERWLIDPEMSISDPFGGSNADAIDLNAMGVDYGPTVRGGRAKRLRAVAAGVTGRSWRDAPQDRATKGVFTPREDRLDRVALRVDNINRVKIAGSFWVILSIGGEEVARDSFFQSTFSGNCANCVAQAFVHFEFHFDRSLLRAPDGAAQEVKVEVHNIITDQVMPFDEIGNPTISMHQLH